MKRHFYKRSAVVACFFTALLLTITGEGAEKKDSHNTQKVPSTNQYILSRGAVHELLVSKDSKIKVKDIERAKEEYLTQLKGVEKDYPLVAQILKLQQVAQFETVVGTMEHLLLFCSLYQITSSEADRLICEQINIKHCSCGGLSHFIRPPKTAPDGTVIYEGSGVDEALANWTSCWHSCH